MSLSTVLLPMRYSIDLLIDTLGVKPCIFLHPITSYITKNQTRIPPELNSFEYQQLGKNTKTEKNKVRSAIGFLSFPFENHRNTCELDGK